MHDVLLTQRLVLLQLSMGDGSQVTHLSSTGVHRLNQQRALAEQLVQHLGGLGDERLLGLLHAALFLQVLLEGAGLVGFGLQGGGDLLQLLGQGCVLGCEGGTSLLQCRQLD